MIGSSENRVSYNGNGVTTEFPYAFKILEATDLKLLLIKADGAETLLTKDYYVDVNKSVVFYPGYSPGVDPPEFDVPPVLATGDRLILYRDVPVNQNNSFGDRWPFNIIEKALDKLTIICQQILEGTNRSVKVSVGAPADVDTTIPISPGKSFRWSDDGKKLETTEDPAKVLISAETILEETKAVKKEAIADIEAQKGKIVEDVIAALPVYNGEVTSV